MLKVERIDDVPFESSVYKANDFELIKSAKEYLSRVDSECEAKILACNEEVERIKQDAYIEGVKKANIENQILLDESLTKIREYLDKLNQNIAQVINSVLLSIGYDCINHEQIKNLIVKEINKLNTTPSMIQVITNKLTYAKVKNLFTNEVQYVIDENLNNNLCICKTNLFSLQIDIADYTKSINDILQKRKIGGK